MLSADGAGMSQCLRSLVLLVRISRNAMNKSSGWMRILWSTTAQPPGIHPENLGRD